MGGCPLHPILEVSGLQACNGRRLLDLENLESFVGKTPSCKWVKNSEPIWASDLALSSAEHRIIRGAWECLCLSNKRMKGRCELHAV